MIEHCIVFPDHFGNKSSSTLPGFCKTADVLWSLYKEFVGILRSLFQPYPFSLMFFQPKPFALCPKISQHMWQVQKSRNKQVQMIFDKGFGIHHVGSLSTPALKGCVGWTHQTFQCLGFQRVSNQNEVEQIWELPPVPGECILISYFPGPVHTFSMISFRRKLSFIEIVVVYCKIASMRDSAGVLGEWSNYHATQAHTSGPAPCRLACCGQTAHSRKRCSLLE